MEAGVRQAFMVMPDNAPLRPDDRIEDRQAKEAGRRRRVIARWQGVWPGHLYNVARLALSFARAQGRLK